MAQSKALFQDVKNLRSQLQLGIGPQHSERRAVLALFLLADLLFIMLHLLHEFAGAPRDARFSLETDRGLSEVFQYLKEFWSAMVLLYLWFRQREWLYLGWAMLFGYLLLDDAMFVHERVGNWTAGVLPELRIGHIRPQDFGELAVSALAGIMFLSVICAGYYYAAPAVRRACRQLFLLLGLLVGFGIGGDLLHRVLQSPVMGFLEDGGELIVMSLICSFVIGLFAENNESKSNAVPATATSR